MPANPSASESPVKRVSSSSQPSSQKGQSSSVSTSTKTRTSSSTLKRNSSESRSVADFSDSVTQTPEKKFNHSASFNETASSTVSSAQHDLPFSKIRSIMTSTPETMRANDEGLFAMTKAAEAFISMLAKGAYEHSKGKIILYSNLADFVQDSENLSHIHEMVPRKVRFSTVEQAVRNAQKAYLED